MAEKKKEVKKMLDQEELSVLSDIATLIEQLKSMNTEQAPVAAPGGEQEMAAAGAQTQEPETGVVEDPKKINVTVSKEADTTTASDAATASDDAKARIEEVIPEETEDNVDEVSKAIVEALKSISNKKAHKSQPNPIVSALQGLTQVVKDLQENQGQLSTAFTNVLDGMGVTEQLKTVEKSGIANKDGTPIISDDSKETVNHMQWLVKQLGGGKTVEKEASEDGKQYYQAPNDKIHKNLGTYDVLKALTIGNNGR